MSREPWWDYCQRHQKTLERIPTFEEWKKARGGT